MSNMSDAFWIGFFNLVAIVVGLYLTYRKAEKAEAAGKESSKIAEKAEEAGKDNSKKIEGISEENKAQHKATNSQLDDMKRILVEKATAEGVLKGRAELQAQIDAKKAAVSEAMKVSPPLHADMPAASPVEPTPVKLIPDEKETFPVDVVVKMDSKNKPEKP